MKSPVVLGSIVGAMVLVGAAAVGTTYVLRHPPRPSAQTLAQTAPPPLSAPPALQQSLPPRSVRLRRVRTHSVRRTCPIPVVYTHRRPRPVRETRIRLVRPVYAPPPAYAPSPLGWRARPYEHAAWRGPAWPGREWRGPGWRGPGWGGAAWGGGGWRRPYGPRWAYEPHPGYGGGWRDW